MLNKPKIENHSSITATHESTASLQFTAPFPPLAQVTKPNLTTAETAYYLNRRPQTLRGWACHEDGPIRPKRIGGLLAWPTSLAKTLAGVAE
jgi:hypothetical protein